MTTKHKADHADEPVKLEAAVTNVNGGPPDKVYVAQQFLDYVSRVHHRSLTEAETTLQGLAVRVLTEYLST